MGTQFNYKIVSEFRINIARDWLVSLKLNTELVKPESVLWDAICCTQQSY
jgi:hypothetical protein